MVRQSTREPKVTKKKATQSKRKRAFRQKPRSLITLNEYMPLQFKDKSLIPIPYYQIEKDGENDDNNDQVTF